MSCFFSILRRKERISKAILVNALVGQFAPLGKKVFSYEQQKLCVFIYSSFLEAFKLLKYICSLKCKIHQRKYKNIHNYTN